MISALIACRDPDLSVAAADYIQENGLRLVERTDKESAAIQAILGLSPDLVICQDLKSLSAKELLEATARYSPNTYYLVCNVSKEFDLLFELMRSGAQNILPAPWCEADLRHALDLFQEQYRAKHAYSESHGSRFRRGLDKKFFEDTIVTHNGNAILSDFDAIDYEYDISFTDGWFQPLYLLIDPRPREIMQPDGFLPVLELEELAKDFFRPRCHALVCYVQDCGLTVILNTSSPIDNCRQLCRQFLSCCSKKLSWFREQNTISIGVGLSSRDATDIPLLVETAKFAGWMRISEGKGRVLEYGDYNSSPYSKHEFLSKESADALRLAVAARSPGELADTIRTVLASTENSGSFISAAISVNDVLIEAFNATADTAVVENSKYLRLAKNMPPMVEKLDSQEQIQHAIIEWALDCMELLQTRTAQTETSVIQTAKQYIVANYKKPLKLEDVAGHVHLTAAYFCMKFRQETGQTFVEYLTKLRLERAKELLRYSNKKIHEIAVEVGFADSRHFSRTFHRHFGMLPTDYRKK